MKLKAEHFWLAFAFVIYAVGIGILAFAFAKAWLLFLTAVLPP